MRLLLSSSKHSQNTDRFQWEGKTWTLQPFKWLGHGVLSRRPFFYHLFTTVFYDSLKSLVKSAKEPEFLLFTFFLYFLCAASFQHFKFCIAKSRIELATYCSRVHLSTVLFQFCLALSAQDWSPDVPAVGKGTFVVPWKATEKRKVLATASEFLCFVYTFDRPIN